MTKPLNEYAPPNTLGGVYDNIQFDQALEPNDPRYVDTIPGRGNFSYSRLYRYLKVDPEKLTFMDGIPPQKVYTIFSGHRGCGKSTELKKIAATLDRDNLFLVVFLDTASELDTNNIQYADVFMALAKMLLQILVDMDITINSIHLKNMESWFFNRILIRENERSYTLDIKTGTEGKTGIPYLCNLFANITTAFRSNATYKDHLRRDIKNTFSQFATAFNQLISAAADQIQDETTRKSIIFIVDGLDKLSGEDANSFFINDVTQLQQVQANFLYAGPIDLLCSGMQTLQLFTCTILPMIKVEERDGTRVEVAYDVLRKMIYKRADKKLFSSSEVVDKIIHFSGGNPRQALQLLQYAYVSAQNDKFDSDSIDKAVQIMASSYRMFLKAEDYKLLYDIDHSAVEEHVQSDHTRKLLYELALLQYNDFWWKSHPVIRTLPGYLKHEQNQPT